MLSSRICDAIIDGGASSFNNTDDNVDASGTDSSSFSRLILLSSVSISGSSFLGLSCRLLLPLLADADGNIDDGADDDEIDDVIAPVTVSVIATIAGGVFERMK